MKPLGPPYTVAVEAGTGVWRWPAEWCGTNWRHWRWGLGWKKECSGTNMLMATGAIGAPPMSPYSLLWVKGCLLKTLALPEGYYPDHRGCSACSKDKTGMGDGAQWHVERWRVNIPTSSPHNWARFVLHGFPKPLRATKLQLPLAVAVTRLIICLHVGALPSLPPVRSPRLASSGITTVTNCLCWGPCLSTRFRGTQAKTMIFKSAKTSVCSSSKRR